MKRVTLLFGWVHNYRRSPLKTMIHAIALLVCLGTSNLVFAENAPALTTPLKIGVIDSQRLFSAAPQAKEAAKRLENEFQGPSQKLTEKQNDFQTKRNK